MDNRLVKKYRFCLSRFTRIQPTYKGFVQNEATKKARK